MDQTKHIEQILNDLTLQKWSVIDQLLPISTSQQIAQQFNQHLPHFKPAAIGTGGQKTLNHQIRGDSTLWIDETNQNDPTFEYCEYLNLLLKRLNQEFYFGIKRYEIHFAHYPVGAFYQKHLDQFKNQTGPRVLSVLYYLNEDWNDSDGGELVLFSPENNESVIQKISPKQNKFACFLSNEIYHEVLPSKKERKSIAGWMRSDL